MHKKPIMFSSMILSITLCLSTTSWPMLWAMLELNSLSFISWITSKKKPSAENSMKYLIIQLAGSAVILMTAVTTEKLNTQIKLGYMMIMAASMMKMGVPPLHSWYMNMSSEMAWKEFLTLATVQKIPPLIIMTTIKMKAVEVFVIMSALIPISTQMKSKNSKEVIINSSMFNSTWLMASTALSNKATMIMSSTYFSSLVPMMKMMEKSTNTKKYFKHTLQSEDSLVIMNAAGIPPSPNFMGKLWIIKTMTMSKASPMAISLITGSIVNLMVYMKSISSSVSKYKPPLKSKKTNNKKPIVTAMALSVVLIHLFDRNKGLDST